MRIYQCHVQLGRLLDELEALFPALKGGRGAAPPDRDLRRVLYSIHALLGAHLEEADEDVEPLLEAKLPLPSSGRPSSLPSSSAPVRWRACTNDRGSGHAPGVVRRLTRQA